jgi:hypothetical protein
MIRNRNHTPWQDDFDDLCEALKDRLGQPTAALQSSSQKSLYLRADSAEAGNGHIGSSLPVPSKSTTDSCFFRPPTYDGAAAAGASRVLVSAAAAVEDTSADELEGLVSELQILADESDRLRRGLARLLVLTEAAARRRSCGQKSGQCQTHTEKDTNHGTSQPNHCHPLDVTGQTRKAISDHSDRADFTPISVPSPIAAISSPQVQDAVTVQLAQQAVEAPAIPNFSSTVIQLEQNVQSKSSQLVPVSTMGSAATAVDLDGAEFRFAACGPGNRAVPRSENGWACGNGDGSAGGRIELVASEREGKVRSEAQAQVGPGSTQWVQGGSFRHGAGRADAKEIARASQLAESEAADRLASCHSQQAERLCRDSTGIPEFNQPEQHHRSWTGPVCKAPPPISADLPDHTSLAASGSMMKVVGGLGNPAGWGGLGVAGSDVHCQPLSPDPLQSSLVANGASNGDSAGASEAIRYCV